MTVGFWDLVRRPFVSRAVPQPRDTGDNGLAAYMSTWATTPNTERVVGGFDQFAQMAYASNSVVFACENRRIQVFSEARFKYRALDDKHLFGDPSLSKLENPWPNGSTGDLLTRMEQDAALSGSAYVRDAGDRLERLRPDWVTVVSQVVADAQGEEVREIVGYLYEPVGDPGRSVAFYPVEEVAHWTPLPNPAMNWLGISWLTPVIREVNGDLQMSGFRDSFFTNAATPNLIIKYAKDIAPEAKRALLEGINARHSGPLNAFGTLVLDNGGDPMIVGADMQGTAFDALQAAGETRIASAAGVPAIVAGLRQGMLASQPGEYEAASRQFVDLTMRPLWRGACAALAKLIDVPAGAELWYDVTDVSALAQGESDKAATLAQMATTMNMWIMAGYTPDSVTAAATAGDPSLLKHSGLVSVQMQQLSAPASVPASEPAQDMQPPVNGKTPALMGMGG